MHSLYIVEEGVESGETSGFHGEGTCEINATCEEDTTFM